MGDQHQKMISHRNDDDDDDDDDGEGEVEKEKRRFKLLIQTQGGPNYYVITTPRFVVKRHHEHHTAP
jgi:hypothetical protein